MDHVPILPTNLFPIDRDVDSRAKPDLFDLLWADQATRILAVHRGKVLLHPTGAGFEKLRLLATDEVPSASYRVYLGKTTVNDSEPIGTPVVLAVLSENSAAAIEAEESAWHDLRRKPGGLSERDSALYLQALALANFHASHAYCSHCGTPTVIELGGWSRRCFEDGKQTFPRTDPAVIVAVIDDEDRILLGSQGVWEDNRWSILAGFVEAGESANAAAVREVHEEAGVIIHDLEFLGSQSWPFPYSLMLGFKAKLAPGVTPAQIRPDGEEIAKVKWFTRQEISDGLATGKLLMPGPITIARTIIEHWFGGPLDA